MSIKLNTVSNITPKRKSTSEDCLSPMNSIAEENVTEEEKNSLSLNPFDVKAESLYYSSCSPFLSTFPTNKKDNGNFRWSIEQMSILCPADIDETSHPETCVDSDQESQAQKAIDVFFSQSSIVPSPWSNSPSAKGSRNDFKWRRTNVFYNKPEVINFEASTQTTLSIPPDVDLQNILGQYFNFNEAEESFSSRENSREEIDPMSTSSLRRKLFVNEEECASPTKIENKNLLSARLWSTPTSKSHSAQSTPASDVLSSSPITPPNCSEFCNVLSSPPVSPIAANYQTINECVDMKSFNEESSSDVYYTPENNTVGHVSEMSILTESQDANPFPSMSEKQDTGYVTGSISSSQNMNFSEVNYGIVSRINPMMKECDLSNSACAVPHKNSSPSITDSLSFDGHTACNLKAYSWVPTCSSTPAHMLNDG